MGGLYAPLSGVGLTARIPAAIGGPARCNSHRFTRTDSVDPYLIEHRI